MPTPDSYTVGWICAVHVEIVAARAFLDEVHDDLDEVPVNDTNSYILGRIKKHNIVIASLPHGKYGLVSATSVARNMAHTFTNVRIGLMVGIAGGVPSKRHDIRLGDIVVSSPGNGAGGVLQYDYGKTIQGKRFVRTGHLNSPPDVILGAVSVLRAQYEEDGNGISKTIETTLATKKRLQSKYGRPEQATDRLYLATYDHRGSTEATCMAVCDSNETVPRPPRSEHDDETTIHYGLVASANQLMKDANIRDKLSEEEDVLCFEMEAAGLMDQFPCMVVRGICDYSDTHKSDAWQGYSAMAAAAYARDLLAKITPNKVIAERKLGEILFAG